MSCCGSTALQSVLFSLTPPSARPSVLSCLVEPGEHTVTSNHAPVFFTLHYNRDFPNTYTLGKHLTEELVADFHKEGRLPVVIVRPTLVCGLSGAPYPGYCGNLAGVWLSVGGARRMVAFVWAAGWRRGGVQRVFAYSTECVVEHAQRALLCSE